jgi:uncharacterized membrane protein YbhN (UPF0104 family)
VVFRWLIGVCIFIGFVIWIEIQFGWMELLNTWRYLSAGKVLVALCLFFASYTIRAVRIFDYFFTRMAGRFTVCLRLVLYHTFFNNMLPMRSGELAFPVLMGRYFSVSPAESLPALLWLRFMDFHFLLLIGSMALWWKIIISPAVLPVYLGVLAFPVLFFILRKKASNWAESKETRFYRFAARLIHGIPDKTGVFWRTWLWTVLNWSVKLCVFAWLLKQFVDVPFTHALLGSLMGEMSSVLPVHGFAGAGTYEGGIMMALIPLGVSLENAVQAAVNVHVFLLFATILCAGTGFLLGLSSFDKTKPDHV